MGNSEERVAIVTGAASGMGEALATNLCQRGWKVACVDIQRPAGETLAASLGPNAKFFQANVGEYESQAQMFNSVWSTWGRIDALCANAGIVDRSSVYILRERGRHEIPPAPDTSCTDVDYKGVIYGTQLAIHFMRQNKVPGGKIVCTASVAGIFPHQSYPEYCGAKAAVITFVRCVAPILKTKDNITINAILPGIVHTKIMPPAMIAAVDPECLTPPANIVSGYNKYLEDDSLTGQILECSGQKQFVYELPDPGLGNLTTRACTVWDPLFVMMHGEPSESPDAIL